MSPTRKGMQTKNRILNCAKQLYYENGFEKTTIQHIADDAGSTLGSMTYHFSTKAEFIRTIFSDYSSAIVDAVTEAHAKSKSFDFLKREVFCNYIYFRNIMDDPKIKAFYAEILADDEYFSVVHSLMEPLFAYALNDVEPGVYAASLEADKGARRESLSAYCAGHIDLSVDKMASFTIINTTRAIGIPVETTEKYLKEVRRFLKTHDEVISTIRLIP
jgi:AcrR family transcriptional regulator